MARGKGKNGTGHAKKRHIERYEHTDKKRINNPPVGLVTPETDPLLPTHKIYDYVQPVPTVKPRKDLDYDPHLDPQLVWAGKKEHASFEVPTVSLHVHETIDPRTIIEAVRKRNGNGLPTQPSLFERPEEKMPLRDAIEFYRHAHGWSNRLIAGDSLLVMNSLLEKEGMAGQVQMVYIDPPYGIKYGSNFQPFVNKRDVKDGKDEDLTQEPEMIQAFRDTWELGIHSYLTYLRDRLLLARELLHESGSCFVQISDENIHLIRDLMDEIFGRKNFLSQIAFFKTGAQTDHGLAANSDFLLWYAKNAKQVKSRRLYANDGGWAARSADIWVEFPDGKRVRRRSFEGSDDKEVRLFSHRSLQSTTPSESSQFPFEFEGEEFRPKRGWSTTFEGMHKLAQCRRIIKIGVGIRFVVFLEDFPYSNLTTVWDDTGTGSFLEPNIYVVQTAVKVVQRCMLMTTDPGDLVFDPTCGSGTTAFVAEQWGRRWITTRHLAGRDHVGQAAADGRGI